MHIEHFLFFPVVVLVALVLIILSWRVLFRLFVFFIMICFFWYLLSLTDLVRSPISFMKNYKESKQSESQKVV